MPRGWTFIATPQWLKNNKRSKTLIGLGHLQYRLFIHFRCRSTRATSPPAAAMTRILCVAEKPSIAKAVAGHLSGGHYQTVSAEIEG